MRLDTATKISLSNLRRSDAVGLSTDNLASRHTVYIQFRHTVQSVYSLCDAVQSELWWSKWWGERRWTLPQPAQSGLFFTANHLEQHKEQRQLSVSAAAACSHSISRSTLHTASSAWLSRQSPSLRREKLVRNLFRRRAPVHLLFSSARRQRRGVRWVSAVVAVVL